MIYVECKPDTTIARTLAGNIDVHHSFGTSRVCSNLMNESNNKGMIDEEHKHPYIKELSLSNSIQNLSDFDILVCNDKTRHNLLVQLCPRLEEWVIKSANQANVQLSSYSLPSNPLDLKRVLDIGHRETINHFRMLIQKLNQCSPRVQTLAQYIR